MVLSNHPGYPRFAGEAIPAAQIGAMLDALEANGWLADTAAVITGYLPSPAHVAEARSAVERVRRANPGALYLCDPVFGDEPEGLYLSEATASAIRDELLPLASLATPNRFELSWLAGLPVGDPPEARQAAWALGVPTVLATSIPAERQPPRQRARAQRRGHRLLRAPASDGPARHRRSARRHVPRQSPQRRDAGQCARRRRVGGRCQRRRQHGPG